MIGARISGIGIALPDRVLANAELAARWDIPELWLFERSGIHERRMASPDQDAATLGADAARQALERAGIPPEDIDLIVCATITATRRFPAAACLVGASLGTRAPAYDLNAGCSGFLFALAQADAAIKAGSAQRVLVVGTDVMSRIIDYDDPRSAILFGDGAGAVVVEGASEDALGPFDLHADGSNPEILTLDDRDLVQMHGREVYRKAVAAMTSSLLSLLARSELNANDIDLVVPHQANQRIIDAVRDRSGLNPDQVFSNIEYRGNTSAASIPIALYEADDQGVLKEGHRVALTAFGAGLCWGSSLLSWSGVNAASEAPKEAAHV